MTDHPTISRKYLTFAGLTLDDANLVMEEIERLRGEAHELKAKLAAEKAHGVELAGSLEACQKACAEMRYMLDAASLRTDVDWPDNYEFGHNFVHKDKLADALKAVEISCEVLAIAQKEASELRKALDDKIND